MRHIKFSTIIILSYSLLLTSYPVYADDSDHFKIREMSSKKSQRLFNEIAINLLNGRSHFVSLESMVKVLKDYEVVEFHSKEIEPAGEIIVKEVAYRMLKHHYLPRVGDKIKIYKLQKEFLKDTGINHASYRGSEPIVRVPLELATVKDNNELMAIYWKGLVLQVSDAIERLWLERINYDKVSTQDRLNKNALVEAISLLRRKFIEGEDISDYLERRSPANDIVRAAIRKVELWLEESAASETDSTVLAEIMIQYVMFSDPEGILNITEDINSLRGVDELRYALNQRIIETTETIKSHNSADYGVFAMLQSLLNKISGRVGLFPNNSKDYPAGIDSQKSRHSA